MIESDFHVPAVLDYGATFLWAVTGALVAVRRGCDVVGVAMIGLVSAVGGTFALAHALRHRPVPAVLTRLGAVSYSLYLLHLLVLGLAVRLTGDPLIVTLVFVAGTLSVAWLAHRWVELPGQALGRRIGERFPVINIATEGGTPRTGSFGKQRESV